MGSLVIKGPNYIEGEITLGGNKNIALPALAASVLASTGCTILHNVPDIVDVRTMLKILETLGAKCHVDGTDVTIDATRIHSREIPAELCHKVRTSILFAGPLACRLGSVTLANPGGDPIGRRRLDTHFYGLGKLGLALDFQNDALKLKRVDEPKTCEMFLDEASVTATEHILMTG